MPHLYLTLITLELDRFTTLLQGDQQSSLNLKNPVFILMQHQIKYGQFSIQLKSHQLLHSKMFQTTTTTLTHVSQKQHVWLLEMLSQIEVFVWITGMVHMNQLKLLYQQQINHIGMLQYQHGQESQTHLFHHMPIHLLICYY